MSNCAHKQSTYKLFKLPMCVRCKQEFVLVMAAYDYNGHTKLVEEWECPKCHKAVARGKLKENIPTEQDIWLSKWCKNEERRDEYRGKREGY